MIDDGPSSLATLPPDAPELVARMLEDLDLGLDATMVGRAVESCALLDEVATQLARTRSRVLRVHAPSPGSLTVAGLLTQLRPPGEGAGQPPEQGIEALTRLGPKCDRVVLLVSNAEALERNAMRAIQLAAEAQPKLRLVLAGAPAFLADLEHADLSLLHSRLNRTLDPQDGDEDDATGMPDARPQAAASGKPMPANDANRFNKIGAAAMAVLATVGFSVFLSQTGADTAATTRPSAARLPPADAGLAELQAASQARRITQDPPRTMDASRDEPPPPAPAALNPPSLADAPTLVAPTAPADPALPEPPIGSVAPPTPIESLALPAPAATTRQAALPPTRKHREPTTRHVAASAPRHGSRPPAGVDQPGKDQANADRHRVAEAQSPGLQHHPSDRRPDPRPAVRYEPSQQQGGDPWPLPPDEPRGTIGTYSGNPGGVRSFRSGS